MADRIIAYHQVYITRKHSQHLSESRLRHPQRRARKQWGPAQWALAACLSLRRRIIRESRPEQIIVLSAIHQSLNRIDSFSSESNTPFVGLVSIEITFNVCSACLLFSCNDAYACVPFVGRIGCLAVQEPEPFGLFMSLVHFVTKAVARSPIAFVFIFHAPRRKTRARRPDYSLACPMKV